jgi:peptidyl-prolyl cis-trans isomerase C
VPEFSKVLVTLDKGKTTETAVQSQFGWHIIRVDDVRTASFPPFDQVRPQLQEVAQRDRIDKLLAELRSKAKIE